VPELPDLEAIRGFLNATILDIRIEAAETPQPLVIRMPTAKEFSSILENNAFKGVERRGKYLLFSLQTQHILAVNPMLTGRFQYCDKGERRRAKTCFILSLGNVRELRYYDDRLMGKIYLVPDGDLGLIPRFKDMGPEALSPEVSLELFQKRLRRHPGQIKNILVNDTFLAGIGNAYADEILFKAGIYPYKLRPRLSLSEVESLYLAIDTVLNEAIPIVAQRMGDKIDMKVRDFLKVHGKGGQPCPNCGAVISDIRANQRLTNFCRHCQR